MSWIKNLLIISGVVFLFLLIIESSVKHLLGFKEVIQGDTSCKVYNSEKDFSYYKSNCNLFHKHWEQDIGINYNSNGFGRRDGAKNTGEKLIAFIGDSFSFGAMVPIDENFNYKALKYLGDLNYGGHNFGVSGEQFQNILAKLRNLDFSKYEKIVYGLTPNDLFDIVEGTTLSSITTGEEPKSDYSSSLLFYEKIKKILLSTATSRALLHKFMSNDNVYFKTYMSRKPYSDYLKSPLPDNYSAALEEALDQLSKLNSNLKSKILILLLPQRIEVVASRLNILKSDFSDKFLSICEAKKISCGISNISKLSQLDESHFPVDGHLTIEGNDIIAHDLVKLLKQ
jgi:hypothetical protein